MCGSCIGNPRPSKSPLFVPVQVPLPLPSSIPYNQSPLFVRVRASTLVALLCTSSSFRVRPASLPPPPLLPFGFRCYSSSSLPCTTRFSFSWRSLLSGRLLKSLFRLERHLTLLVRCEYVVRVHFLAIFRRLYYAIRDGTLVAHEPHPHQSSPTVSCHPYTHTLVHSHTRVRTRI